MQRRIGKSRDYKFLSRREISSASKRGVLFNIVSNEQTIRLRKRGLVNVCDPLVSRIPPKRQINRLSASEMTRSYSSLWCHVRDNKPNTEVSDRASSRRAYELVLGAISMPFFSAYVSFTNAESIKIIREYMWNKTYRSTRDSI